jgi:hypothetical protein
MSRACWAEADMARAKTLFRSTDWSLKRIATETGIPISTVHLHARRNRWRRGDGAEAASRTPPSLLRAQRTFQGNAAERRRLVMERVWALLERHLEDAEARAHLPADVTVREREARFMAGVLKNLREAAQMLEACRAKSNPSGDEERASDDRDPVPVARTPDEIRSAFAELVAGLFEGGVPSNDRPVAARRAGLADPAMDSEGP